MNNENKINKFAAAFINAQKDMGNAVKDSKNPFFKNSYACLNSVREACLPALNAHGIAVLQPIVQIDGKNFVKTLLLHESGESMEGFTEILFAKQNDPQAQGSGITYARRYGLQSLVNIAAEDDDGNAAAKPSNQNQFQKIANAAKEDDEEIKRKAAEDFFQKAKQDIESCGSYAEVESLIEKEKTKINRLEKYYKELYDLLLESVEAMKMELGNE